MASHPRTMRESVRRSSAGLPPEARVTAVSPRGPSGKPNGSDYLGEGHLTQVAHPVSGRHAGCAGTAGSATYRWPGARGGLARCAGRVRARAAHAVCGGPARHHREPDRASAAREREAHRSACRSPARHVGACSFASGATDPRRFHRGSRTPRRRLAADHLRSRPGSVRSRDPRALSHRAGNQERTALCARAKAPAPIARK